MPRRISLTLSLLLFYPITVIIDEGCCLGAVSSSPLSYDSSRAAAVVVVIVGVGVGIVVVVVMVVVVIITVAVKLVVVPILVVTLVEVVVQW